VCENRFYQFDSPFRRNDEMGDTSFKSGSKMGMEMRRRKCGYELLKSLLLTVALRIKA